MCNWIQKELANGAAKMPSYLPYLVPKLSAHPWLSNKTDRKSIYDYSPANSRQAKRKTLPQELHIQSWMLYRWRFLMAPEFCSAFRHFGCLWAQMNLLAMVLNLCVTESVNLRLAYCRLLSSRMDENARMRVLSTDAYAALLSTEQLDAREQARREVLLSSRDGGPAYFPTNAKRKGGMSFRRARRISRPTPQGRKGKKKQFPTNKGGIAQRQCSCVFFHFV